MFDFIKNLFKHKQAQSNAGSQPNCLDVLETNDDSEQVASERHEGTGFIIIRGEDMVDMKEPLFEHTDLPSAQLDEPSEQEPPSEPVEPDNYMSGDRSGARMMRDIQLRKAAISHWNSALAKYRLRPHSGMTDGSNAKEFQYFDAIQADPQLRERELEQPAMSMEALALSKFVSDGLKGQMVNSFIERSMESIREQQENGAPPLGSILDYWINKEDLDADTEDGAAKLRQMFTVYDANKNEDQAVREEPAEPLPAFDDQDAYTRWLLKVAEECTESDEVLWMLAKDDNVDVRFCLAENYNINPEILKELSGDENPYVAHRARKTLERSRAPGTVVDHDFSNSSINNRKRG